MNRLWSPIVVSPPPPGVPRLMVTNSRKMLRRADDEPRPLAVVLRSCGARPIDAIGKICVSSPISVQPSMTTDAPIRQSRADA